MKRHKAAWEPEMIAKYLAAGPKKGSIGVDAGEVVSGDGDADGGQEVRLKVVDGGAEHHYRWRPMERGMEQMD